MSPFENPVVLEESAAVWRRALARRAERLAREAAAAGPGVAAGARPAADREAS